MEDDKTKVTDVAQTISKDFTIGDSDSLIPTADFQSLEEFRSYLTEKLAYLLDNKYNKLINALYRIDVSEEKLGELFSGSNRDYIPAALADLIIERSIQKIRFRQKYKNGEL